MNDFMGMKANVRVRIEQCWICPALRNITACSETNRENPNFFTFHSSRGHFP